MDSTVGENKKNDIRFVAEEMEVVQNNYLVTASV